MTLLLILSGPAILPASFNDAVGEVIHSFKDSFTGIIPNELLQPNLKLTIEAGGLINVSDNLSISAPNKKRMTNFEVNVFKKQTSEFPLGWEKEFAEKFPASEFIVQNVRVLLKEAAI